MKRAMLLAVSLVTLASLTPSFAANTAAGGGDNKVMAGCKAIGRGIMWGPKKVGAGLKAVGKKVTGK